jgi:small subunit ribosomal protein S3Ae
LKRTDPGAEKSYRKIRLVVEDVEGAACFTNFHGLDVTKDKLCSLIRKWQSTIEAYVDVKTSDEYFLRIFVIGFTARTSRQLKATTYATAAKVKLIRKKMVEVVMKKVQGNSLRQLVPVLLEEKIEEDIKKACAKFYPLQNVLLRKVKILKKPRFDAAKMAEFYGDHKTIGSDILAVAVQSDEPKNLLAEEKKEEK